MFIVPFFRSAGRSLFRVSAFVAVTSAALFAQTPSAADGFDPDVDGNVYVVVAQPDGRLLIGGQFGSVRGFPRNNLARLNADGSLDESFNPNANTTDGRPGVVRAIVLDATGRIVIGGDFTTLQPGASGPVVTRNRIARLNADGTLDTFNPNLGGLLQPQVFALALQADGKIVAGGSFTSAQPTGAVTAVPRNYLARFNVDGSLDLAFDPNPNGFVLALAAHVQNKIVVGGGFTSLWPAGDAAPSGRNRIARLNANGTVDSDFSPNANNAVSALAIQRDGKIVLGGVFTTLQPPTDISPANRIHIGRLNADGSLDSEFYPRVEGNVVALALQGDGSILVGGTFSSAWGRGSTEGNRSNLARFLPDGALDSNFAPVLNATVDALAALPDGRIVAGGHFTRVLAVGATAGLVRNHLARINGDGSFDAGFELDTGGRTLASVTQTDGKVVIAGTFTSVGGATHNYVARLNADGTVDNAYNPDFNGRVYALAYDAATNKVVVGGAFTTIGGETRNRLARLNSNGTIDSEFVPSLDGQVGAIVLQSDGKILVGGSFSSVQGVGATTPVQRPNLLRLNANGSLDTAFDPEPNSSVASMLVQSDGKIVIGGLFTTLQPGGAPTITTTNGVSTTTLSTAALTARNNLARLNADGSLDMTFNPQPNGQVSAIVAQSDGKLIIAGSFTALNPEGAPSVTTTNADGTKTTTTVSTRARLARLNANGTVDATYDPNPNGNVLALALQSDKLLLGGTFTTLQPLQPTAATTFTLRKYAARLNADGTVDNAFNLDLNELGGNRVDSIRVQADGRIFLGGNFSSLQPTGAAARLTRRNFARLLPGATSAANVTVDPAFDVNAGGSTGALVNALVVQADGKILVGGSFSDLGGAKSTNLARFRSEGLADTAFSPSLATDGPVNAIALRPNISAVPSQVGGFAWLNANGTLRPGFAPTVRLSGTVSAVAVDRSGRVLLGGSFANLTDASGGGLIRLNADGRVDPTFNFPNPNGQVTGIIVQSDGRIVVVGAFSVIGGVSRNFIARIDDNGAIDITYNPSANGRINAVVVESDGRVLIGGNFTTFTPNATATAVTRNALARVNIDGTIDSAYDPALNANVNALALQSDGKVVAGGAFTSAQPNGGLTAFTRNGLARFNTDGSLDQNFDPNANSAVYALAFVPASGQIIVGGAFTTLQPTLPGGNAKLTTRNNLARINSDGAVDASFDPNANSAVTTLALEPSGSILVGGTFSTLQPAGTAVAITRNRFARLNADGSLDLNFNPDANGGIAVVAARPDGTVFVGGNFDGLQLNGSIYVGGVFNTIGGLPARNFAALTDNGSVSTTFQPRPDGAVNAVLVLPDGRAIVGGAFTTIAGTARNRVARFTTDAALDATFNPNVGGAVNALAAQADGKILIGGAFTAVGGQARANLARLNADGTLDATFAPTGTNAVTALTVQADGRVLVLTGGNLLSRLNSDGSTDGSFVAVNGGANGLGSFALQADGRVIVAGSFTALGANAVARLARVNPNGTIDGAFNPAPNGRVTAVTLQADGRVMIGGGFTNVGGQPRVGLARLAATSAATSQLGVSANRNTVTWNRGGTAGDVSAVRFEQSIDGRATWTALGDGVRTGTAGDWQRAGLNLPASGLFYIRARGIAPSGGGTSSGVFESVREFNFTNPIAGAASIIAQVPAQAAAPSLVFDPVTGVASRATVTMVAGEGTVEILAASAPLASSVGLVTPARLTNLSTRGRVSPANPLILGFAISGTDARRVLVRAVGPGLAGFGVGDALGATRLQIFNSAGTLMLANEGWANATDLTQAAAATGAFPLRAGSADSAAILTLAPGNYSLVVLDPRGGAGVALAEIYDAGTGTGSRLVNVSSRGTAGSGEAALISGFVIAGGGATENLLLRGVGPGLVRFGTTGVLVDPAIALYDAEGRLLGTNDNWVSSIGTISTAAASVGAFALDVGSKDAAVLATLPSGAYTIQVTGATSGTGLLEIYELK